MLALCAAQKAMARESHNSRALRGEWCLPSWRAIVRGVQMVGAVFRVWLDPLAAEAATRTLLATAIQAPDSRPSTDGYAMIRRICAVAAGVSAT